ncbi:hypothetical protein BKA81DRAFT_352550 [Phyllosticta paracitricarpa]
MTRFPPVALSWFGLRLRFALPYSTTKQQRPLSNHLRKKQRLLRLFSDPSSLANISSGHKRRQKQKNRLGRQ